MLTEFYDRLPQSVRPHVSRLYRRAVQVNYGHELYARTHHIDSVTYRSYEYRSPSSEPLLDELLERTTPADTVYDVGAYVGDYALPLAAKGCSVSAFEPNPLTYDLLQRNVRCNDFDLSRYNLGLSDEESTSEFYLSTAPALSSFHRDNSEADGAAVRETRTVEATTIDSLVESEETAPPDHVKIDVEGHGLAVLRGAAKTLETHAPTVYFETHERDGDDDPVETVRSFFGDRPYEVRERGQVRICTPESV